MARMSTSSILVAAAAIFATAADRAHAQPYGDVLRDTILDTVVQSDERKYWRVSTYPTDNFGIATMYDGDKPTNFLCGTYRCLGLEGRESELSRYVESGTGATVTLSDAQRKALQASGMIPKVLRVLGINVSAATQGVRMVSLEIGPAKLRQMNPDRVEARIREVNNPRVLRALVGGRLRYVTADIVAPLRIMIDVDRTQAASIAVKLTGVAGATGSTPSAAPASPSPAAPVNVPPSPTATVTAGIPDARIRVGAETAPPSQAPDPCATPPRTGASPPVGPSPAAVAEAPLFSIRVDREAEARFALTTCRPLVVAVVLKRQPGGGALGEPGKGALRDGLPVTGPIALRNVDQ